MTVPVPPTWWRDGPPRSAAELLAEHFARAAQHDPDLPLRLVLDALAAMAALATTGHGDPVWPQTEATFLAALHAQAARWSRLTPEPRMSAQITEVTSFADAGAGRHVYAVDLPGFTNVRATIEWDNGSGLRDGRWSATIPAGNQDALARALESIGSRAGLETIRTRAGREYVLFVQSVDMPSVAGLFGAAGGPQEASVLGWFKPAPERREPKDTTAYRGTWERSDNDRPESCGDPQCDCGERWTPGWPPQGS